MDASNGSTPPGSFDIQVEELDETDDLAQHPENVKITLWPHQLTLLKRCQEFENDKVPLSKFKSLTRPPMSVDPTDFLRTQIGIIGDKVGSGKSYVILSLIANNDIATSSASTIKSYGRNKVVFSMVPERTVNIRTNLLVIPHNLVTQWESYIKEFSSDLKYLIISRARHIDDLYERTDRNLSDINLIVVTATTYLRFAHFLTSRDLRMQRVIYDEVDNVNLPSCVPIKANFYWFVTASYGNLLYPKGYNKYDYALRRNIWYCAGLRNSGFIKDLFTDITDNLEKRYCRVLVIKNKEAYIERSISLPPIQNHYIHSKTPVAVALLDGFVDREIIQSLNAGDATSAMQRIAPTQRNTEENLVTIQIDRYVRELRNYDARIDMATNLIEFNTPEQRDAEISRLHNRRRDLQAKIDGINERIKSTNTCCICFDDIKQKSIAPCCSNAYCFLCVNLWLIQHPNCPLCKEPLTPGAIYVVDETMSTETGADASSSIITPTVQEPSSAFDKLKNLEMILRHKIAADGKVLIYSSYEMSFTNIVPILLQHNIPFAHLKGHEPHIRYTLERYKTGELRVLLVNTRNYGSGLNLECTTDIIMFHKFEGEIEKQVIGRANRPGRTSPLSLWYLLYENEMLQISQ